MSISIITPIIYPTSAEFWRSAYPIHFDYAFNNKVLSDLPTEYKVSANAARGAAERFSLPTPLSLVSTSINKTHVGKFYTTTKQKSPLPPKSFFKIPNFNIFVACPELTFIQAARHLNLISLIRLGFDLCAQYYSDKEAIFGQTSRPPITTPEQIIKYAMNSNNMRGSVKAIRAAKYVLDSSNSPMETRLAIILEIPVRWGGYGLTGLEMNGTVKLSKLGVQLTGASEIHGDLVWRKKKLVVEYNSKTVHNNDLTYYKDANRINAYRDSGWNCIVVTPNNIKTFGAIENIAEIIRKQLGRPSRQELLSTYEKERKEVFNKLFTKL